MNARGKKNKIHSHSSKGTEWMQGKKTDNAFFHSSFPFGNVFVVPKEKKKTYLHTHDNITPT
jgi:hypothetical protein